MPQRQSTRISHPLAERHETLWLSFSALHKDITALGLKKPNAPVSDAVRIQAEGLLSDCAPFIRQRRDMADLREKLAQCSTSSTADVSGWLSLLSPPPPLAS